MWLISTVILAEVHAQGPGEILRGIEGTVGSPPARSGDEVHRDMGRPLDRLGRHPMNPPTPTPMPGGALNSPYTTYCVTAFGSCALPAPLPRGYPCVCQSQAGPLSGYAGP